MNKQVLQANREQAERLAELGLRLAQLRQQQGISLEDIARATRIQPRLLRAIEAGDLEVLPESVYIQSFLRQYAGAIGLDGAAFASEFPTRFGLPEPRTPWRSLPGAQLRPVHLYVLYMCLIVSAVNGLSYFLNRSSPQAQLPEVQSLQPVPGMVIGPINPNQNPTSAIANVASKPATPEKAVRVGLTLTSQSWVRVVADGKTEYEGVLSEGTQKTWMADKQVVVRAGNAGGVMVTYNDSTAKQLGQPGAIEEVAFPPDPQMAQLSPVINEMSVTSPDSSF
ncbi:MAG: helix-turn-helix domain-containing protein [Leptolyngbyaceae cyanobacterium CSU_1_3]|nr:helix-turn-helix domain-containing protein [Leptolyngbyaceae cyanobacterium CSU_1_3]